VVLVALEFFLAGLNSVLCRLIDSVTFFIADSLRSYVSHADHGACFESGPCHLRESHLFTTSWSGLVPNPLTGQYDSAMADSAATVIATSFLWDLLSQFF